MDKTELFNELTSKVKWELNKLPDLETDEVAAKAIATIAATQTIEVLKIYHELVNR